MRLHVRSAAVVVVVVVVLAAAGCGNPPSRVYGVVKYQGEPLPKAFLTFRGSDGRAYTANTAADGRYEVAGLPPGPVAVIVQGHVPAKAPPKDAPAGGTGRKASDAESARGDSSQGPPLPEKYQDPAQSGLGFDLTGREFEYNFELK